MPQQATATVAHPVEPASSTGSGTVLSIEFARRRRSRQTSRDVIRVLVVGGHTLSRAGLRRLLEEDAGLAVVGEAATGRGGA